MDSILRAAAVYAFLLVVFRIAGKRSLAQITTFDLVLTLIISEAIQQALIDTDDSMTNAFLIVVALIGMDITLSLAKRRWPAIDRLLEGLPLVIMERGELHRDRMAKERVDEEDILQAAREKQGLGKMADVEHAVVERSGGITVIPKRG